MQPRNHWLILRFLIVLMMLVLRIPTLISHQNLMRKNQILLLPLKTKGQSCGIRLFNLKGGQSTEEDSDSTPLPQFSSRSDHDSSSYVRDDESVGDLLKDAMATNQTQGANAINASHLKARNGFNFTQTGNSSSHQHLECLCKQGPVLKQLLSPGSAKDNGTITPGEEVFFHYQIFFRDDLIADSRAHDGVLLPPARLVLAAPPLPDSAPAAAPCGAGAGDVWDVAMRSMRRGETSLFLVHGQERTAQLLARPFLRRAGQAPPPEGGPVRVAVELLSHGLLDLEEDGGAVYRCERAGAGWATPRPADEVLVSYVGCADGVEVASSRGWRWTQLGVGLLPLGLEIALSRHLPPPPPRPRPPGVVRAPCATARSAVRDGARRGARRRAAVRDGS
jgi:hypothetical protein